jgi:hypothetical protein
MLSIKYSISPIILAVLFMLFIFVGLPGKSISADEVVTQQEKPYANAELNDFCKYDPSNSKKEGPPWVMLLLLTQPDKPVNGTCGLANGEPFWTEPTTNLCSVGTASLVERKSVGIGYSFTWICKGSNGGSDTMCETFPVDPHPPPFS